MHGRIFDEPDSLGEPKHTRRQFLKSSLGGSAMLVAGALLPTGCASYPARSGHLEALDAKTAAVFDAIADALVDDGTGRLPVPSQLGIAARADKMIAGLHPDVRKQTLLLFNVIEHLTLPFGLQMRRFTRLDRAAQRKYLEGWASSRLGFRRMAFQALKTFVYVNYYTFPETWSVLGYDGPWVGRFEVPPFEPPLAKYTTKEPL